MERTAAAPIARARPLLPMIPRTTQACKARTAAAAPLLRLLAACAASLALYALLFGWVLDRPLAYGFLRREIALKLARGTAVGSPKLVILAGSNGSYSHRCETIEPIVGLPCVNGGLVVGIGLDYLFTRWERRLHPGDVVYLPMEEAQYGRSRAATDLGPDASIMFRHDWRTLARLPPDRWVAALFSFDLRYALMALIERALVAGGFDDPRAGAEGYTDAWGDHTGHTPALGAPYRAVLAHAHPFHATVAEVETGYGTKLIVQFLRWARAHGVRAIGGLPTEFIDSPMHPATRRAIAALYRANGAAFLELPNRSLYPRADFFDTPDHLSEPWQIVQSVAVGDALRRMLDRASARRPGASNPGANDAGTSNPGINNPRANKPGIATRRIVSLRIAGAAFPSVPFSPGPPVPRPSVPRPPAPRQ
ncbi:MAG: hypothetical protein ACREFY_03960 [Acetobacteraceae bacterium]